LRLTDRCGLFRNGGPNTLSAADYHQIAGFIAGVAVRRPADHGISADCQNHTKMTLEQLRRFRSEINAIARRRGVVHVRVFGSVARGETGPNSDVDFLVEVEPGRSILAVGGFLDEVSELIGTPVHVVTAMAFSGPESQRTLREAVAL
jgi:predicted nucleotidyltransferase